VLERLLPASVVVHESAVDIGDVNLSAEEEAVVERAVDKRRREFTTGRACARRALARLGVEPQPIPSGPRGAPCWPKGVVGSITHCEGFRAGAVAWAKDVVTLGIDAEPAAPLPAGLLADVSLPREREQLEELARVDPAVSWDRLLFSAKESVYKAWFPLAERWLGFEDAELTIDRELGRFSARLLVPGPVLDGETLTRLEGRWLAERGLVVTAIALPHHRRR
jgi:4'-phosphopantetheinyl transferase EntD